MNIANKTILITGANRGIGRAVVVEALRRGAKRVYAGSRGAPPSGDARLIPLTLDVTNAAQVERAVGQIENLDLVMNNAGIATYDDLSKPDVIRQNLEVNLFGLLRVTQACLPLLKRSKGAIINHLSIAAIAGVPIMPSYSISKAAALNLTQSLRALLARDGVRVHAAILGPVDTDMTRGLNIPKASPESVAVGIFDGLSRGEEEIFPDPTSQAIADGWHTGSAKALERQFAAFVPATASTAP